MSNYAEKFRQSRTNIPTPVRRRQDRLARLQNNPIAPSATDLSKYKMSDDQKMHEYKRLDLQQAQLLDPRRNAQAGRMGDLKLLGPKVNSGVDMIVANAVRSNTGITLEGAHGAKALNADEFFRRREGDGQMTLSVRDHREQLRKAGPEGQAALDYYEGRLKEFEDDYALSLARNNNPDLTEDELIKSVQNMESYDPAFHEDAKRFVESNLPTALKKNREESAKQLREEERIGKMAKQRNVSNLKLLGIADGERMWEAALEDPELMEMLREEAARAGITLYDQYGAALPASPAVQHRMQQEYASADAATAREEKALDAKAQAKTVQEEEAEARKRFDIAGGDPEVSAEAEKLGIPLAQAQQNIEQRRKDQKVEREKAEKRAEERATHDEKRVDKHFEDNEDKIRTRNRAALAVEIEKHGKDSPKAKLFEDLVAFGEDVAPAKYREWEKSSADDARALSFAEEHKDHLTTKGTEATGVSFNAKGKPTIEDFQKFVRFLKVERSILYQQN